MNDITQRLAEALRAGLTPTGNIKDAERVHAQCVEALAAFDATQNGGCKPYKDSAFYVVATWNGERQIWREGFFDSAEDAASAFARYVEDYLTAMPGAPAFNPEIRELEV